MEVWRVEHSTLVSLDCPSAHEGPYIGTNPLRDMKAAHTKYEDTAHPGIRGDVGFLPDNYRDYVCGFPTEEKLYSWFEGWLRPLQDSGYIKAVYNVSRHYVHHGRSNNQLLFAASKAVLTSRNPLLEGSIGDTRRVHW